MSLEPERPVTSGTTFWWKRFLARRVQLALDFGALSVAFVLSYLLRYEFSMSAAVTQDLVSQLPYVVGLGLAAQWLTGVYSLIWRYVGLAELKRFMAASLLAAAPIVAARFGLPSSLRTFRVPLSVCVFNAVLGFSGVLGLRVVRRLVYERYEKQRRAAARRGSLPKKRVLLVGAGQGGVLAVKEILGRGDLDIEVVGFVDDDLAKAGSVIHNIEVLGTTLDIPRLVGRLGIDHAVVTIAAASRAQMSRIVEICESVPIRVRIIPGLYEILQGRVHVSMIRDVQIEDLLGRDPVQLDEAGLQGFLGGKVVLVTGAGGSIGSELVRQVARYRPERLLLVDRSEPFLFQIEQEMMRSSPGLRLTPLIGDIGDAPRMRDIFERFRPQIVLHAAAHKHVPMMELNTGEAVKNNVLGTRTLGEIAGESGCEAFVLISTDKAVKPSSVMGATKRAAEIVGQCLDEAFATRFVAVRFGNVLGSTGSVIPTFHEQIRRGGPVTVTHPDMTRYFMTIPEAAQLVLQAGSLGEGGEVFTLDMGQPVKILDLARDMIRLSGFRPDEDIEIRFTGTRPGEKLVEELSTAADQVDRTRHAKIFIGRTPKPDPQRVRDEVQRMAEAATASDDHAVRAALGRLVPEATLEPCKAEPPVEVRGPVVVRGELETDARHPRLAASF